jgi:hypothetical protein
VIARSASSDHKDRHHTCAISLAEQASRQMQRAPGVVVGVNQTDPNSTCEALFSLNLGAALNHSGEPGSLQTMVPLMFRSED